MTTRAAKKVLEKDWEVTPSRGAATRGKPSGRAVSLPVPGGPFTAVQEPLWGDGDREYTSTSLIGQEAKELVNKINPCQSG